MNVWETLEVLCGSVDGSRAQNYETNRARGDFPLVNRSLMVSFSRSDKKKKSERIIVIKQKCVTKYTWAAHPGKVWVLYQLDLQSFSEDKICIFQELSPIKGS